MQSPRARSRTSSRRASPRSSAASTRATGARGKEPHSRIRATTSGGCCTLAGFTPRQLEPREQSELLRYGVGLTNAARRTTRGSSDLRAADFAGSRDRLEAIALDLEPRVIAFVGKAAYQGVFRERPEHGLQERTLGSASLFVLPSTSPANAAVPWDERLRWFSALRELL